MSLPANPKICVRSASQLLVQWDCRALQPLIPLHGSFTQLRLFSYTCSISALWATPERPFVDLCGRLSLWFSPLQCSVLWTLIVLFSSYTQLSPQLLESVGFCLCLPTLHHDLETLKAISWGSHRVHLICFLFLRDHSFSLHANCCFTCFCGYF